MGSCILSVSSREERIDCQFESLVKHLRDESLQKRARASVQTRIGVYLYKVHPAVVVYHEVVAEQLELVQNLLTLLVLAQSGPESVESLLDG